MSRDNYRILMDFITGHESLRHGPSCVREPGNWNVRKKDFMREESFFKI